MSALARVLLGPMLARVGRTLAAYHHRVIHLPRTERVAAVLGELLREGGGADSVLDVGCGDGRIARAVATALGAGRVLGVDVALRPLVLVEARRYDGVRLPFDDGSFDAVLLSDVLHHALDPRGLLSEALRVARVAVAVKDHLAAGPWSRAVLGAMDRVGNAASAVAVTGGYRCLGEWLALVGAAGGRVAAMRWPVLIHDLPWRLLTRSELQLCLRIEPRPGRART